MVAGAVLRLLRLLLLSLLICTGAVYAQDDNVPEVATSHAPRTIPPVIPSMQAPIKVPRVSKIADGTAVSLRLVSEIRVKEAKPGNLADFVLDHDLWNGDLLIARQGAHVEAVVVEASKAKWASRGSKLVIEISALEMLNGQELPLRGSPAYRGGVGPAAQIGGGLVYQAFDCPICEIAFVPPTLISLFAPGTNKNVRKNTLTTAWLDGDATLDVESLRRVQQQSDSDTGKVQIVRGSYGRIYNRDIYCNGVPLAHLAAKHKIEIELEPGWYRFAINPKKSAMEVFVGAGADLQLITDYDQVYVANEPDKTGKLSGLPPNFAPDRSKNTISFEPFAKHKSELEYLQTAKPIDPSDRYNTKCHPLATEFE